MPQLSLLGFCKPNEGTEQQQDEPASHLDDAGVALDSGLLQQAPPEPAKPRLSTMDQAQVDAENDPSAVNAAPQTGQTVSGKEDHAAAVCPATEVGVSEYELQRRQRMQQNFEKLRSLGLSGGITDVIGVPALAKKRPSKRKSERAPPEASPLRRSTRSRHSGAKTQDGSTDSATAPPVCEVSQNDHEEEKLVPAPWLGPEAALQFPGTQSIADGDGAWHTPLSAADDLAGFHAFHCCISSSKLKAIYSLTWYGRLLMAAGKGGMCSLFSVPEVAQEEELECLATCQLHKSWISDAEMLPPLLSESHATSAASACIEGAPAAMPWVLSASNGGELALWNPAHVDSRGRFSLIAEKKNVHSKGIFGMHMCPEAMGQGERRNAASIEVLSCSKDCSVALTAVKSTGIKVVRKWEDVHAGVAKAVRWRDSQLAASAGNDRAVRLLDPRSQGPTISIIDAHNTSINTLSWASSVAATSSSPCAATVGREHLLLSMSYDPSIKIHDIRRPDRPYAVLCGHTRLRKCKDIQQASFCWGGRGVLCGGEGSDNTKLYLYDIHTAEPVEEPLDPWHSSQGVTSLTAAELGHTVSSVQCNSSGRFVAAAGGRGSITVSKAILK